MNEFKGFDINFNITDKVAIVTGGASGIGEAITDLYVKKGAQVAVIDMKEDIADIEHHKDNVYGFKCDITNTKQVEDTVNAIKEKFGKIDILVNSAGVALLDKAESISEALWNKTLDLNLTASFKLAQIVGRILIEQKEGGKIINMASQNALIALDNHIAYGATKAAIVNVTKSLAYEWAQYGINVNAIAPTIVATELSDKAWVGEKRQEQLDSIPLGRFGDPSEVAAVALFLASDATNFITGENIVIDGGNTIK